MGVYTPSPRVNTAQSRCGLNWKQEPQPEPEADKVNINCLQKAFECLFQVLEKDQARRLMPLLGKCFAAHVLGSKLFPQCVKQLIQGGLEAKEELYIDLACGLIQAVGSMCASEIMKLCSAELTKTYASQKQCTAERFLQSEWFAD